IAIILLVILLFGVMLQAEQLKGDVKVKEREIEDTNFTVLDLTNYRLRVERTRQ
ncbi:hypothetical protein, partial [Staphylococcus aureus]|uniref:hypothetical protein n=1 Tax=Staphylococcus aureus TaxID=1280 RepID=UPI001CC473A3